MVQKILIDYRAVSGKAHRLKAGDPSLNKSQNPCDEE